MPTILFIFVVVAGHGEGAMQVSDAVNVKPRTESAIRRVVVTTGNLPILS